MIKLVDVTKIYKSSENVAIGIQNVNLELNRGEFVAIVGPSGAGKTTLLNVISGMDSYEEGELFLDGKSTSDFTLEDFENYRRANVAFIFQNYQLIDSYTVLENVMIELIFKGFSKKEAKVKAKEILAKVGMGHRLKNRAIKLSGGEKQRVVIARAIASDAQILVCDEPTGNLDSKNSIEIMKLIKEAAKDKLVLLVTHDESLIEGNATRVITVKDGFISSDRVIEKKEVCDKPLEEVCPNKVRTQAYIAFKNILRTPKKSLFILAVFLILSFVLLNSIEYLPTSIIASEVSTVEYDTFVNRDDNRFVIYGDHNVDLSDYTVVKNDSFLDMKFFYASTNTLVTAWVKDGYLKTTMDNIDVLCGRVPERKDEILLIMGDGFPSDYFNHVIGAEVKLGLERYTGYAPITFTIVGIGGYTEEYIEKEKSNYNSTDENTEASLNLYKNINFHITGEAIEYVYDVVKEMYPHLLAKTLVSDFIFISEGDYYEITNGNVSSNEIDISYRYSEVDFELFAGKTKIDLSKYDCNFVYNSDVNFAIRISAHNLIKMAEENNYRCSVYVDNDKISDFKKELDLDGVSYYYIGDLKRYDHTYSLISILEKLFYFVFIFVEVIISLFIVSIITSFVLGTKKKELGVLRVIGLSEKDVLHVLNFELIFLMILSIVISLSFSFVSPYLDLGFDFSHIYNSPIKVVISCVILLLMAYYLSFRWNKKMFKKSAREVLKVGDAL